MAGTGRVPYLPIKVKMTAFVSLSNTSKTEIYLSFNTICKIKQKH
jgi:hypothetical protein